MQKSENYFIDEVTDVDDIESNYITNGSYAQGIPTCNRGMLDQHIMVSQE